MQVQQNFSLRNYNTFGVEAASRYFASFSSVDELENILKTHDSGMPLFVLGGGSNILFTQDYPGLVLKNNVQCFSAEKETDTTVYLKAGGGVPWHSFVLHCIDQNVGGVENLSLIPGSVGASPIQNIGAYGVEIKDVFHELEAYDLQDKKIRKFSKEECAFGYRTSIFKTTMKGRCIILNVTYQLQKSPVFNISYGAIQEQLAIMGGPITVKMVSDAVIAIRQSKLPDPASIGNAGSFFKNPVVTEDFFRTLKVAWPTMPTFKVENGWFKLSAAWLIDQCGWKGYRNGDAGCYPLQPLVLVNYGQATGKEIFHLSEQIMESVFHRFGVTLEREVNIV